MKELRDWCIAILQFMAQVDPSSGVFAHAEQATEAAFQRGDLRGLKMVARDVREWATALSPADQQRLDEVLREQFGRGLTEEAEGLRAEVGRILRRGQIDTQDEYRLLLSRADEIYADPSKQDELKSINELLAGYEAD
ncbi:hypothetical protein KJ059_08940 [Myxococcota bacterium]|nr:hypothetical protein [Myxococcota bacterium]